MRAQPTIIGGETREVVADIERATSAEEVNAGIHELVGHLAVRCAEPAIQEKYAAYPHVDGSLTEYPVYSEGYAQSFDPLAEEVDFYDHWARYGVVVSRAVVPVGIRRSAVERVHQTVATLSDGACDLGQPETYSAMPVDLSGVPILTRGFFELYHDDGLAQLRQAVRVYIHHVLLWGRHDLWTTFDRYGVKLPDHPESAALPLHVDQNPLVHPSFRTIQGVLALDDCPLERGTLIAAPGSKHVFPAYGDMAKGMGEYVELDTEQPIARRLEKYAQPFPLRGGDLVSWDSRTTHANTANLSAKTRYIALIAAGLAREDDPNALAARAAAFASGVGSNVREALLHASKPPRYSNPTGLARIRAPERLTYLGKLLYGQESYRA